jgi:hypothetical protein
LLTGHDKNTKTRPAPPDEALWWAVEGGHDAVAQLLRVHARCRSFTRSRRRHFCRTASAGRASANPDMYAYFCTKVWNSPEYAEQRKAAEAKHAADLKEFY